ncbi:MAG TPA: hypothetical protein V6D22_08895 [Candidatus Obscuribacterales bacterium]
MERKGIVNGVNQGGKAPEPEDVNSRARFKKDGNALVRTLTSILSAFANLVSPIKDDKKRR